MVLILIYFIPCINLPHPPTPSPEGEGESPLLEERVG
jgi:hypothetical protein